MTNDAMNSDGYESRTWKYWKHEEYKEIMIVVLFWALCHYVWRCQLLLIGQTINSNNRINRSNHSRAKQPHLTRLLIMKGKGSQSQSIVSDSLFSFTLGRLQQRCGLGQGAPHLVGADDHGNPGSEWYVIIIYEAPAHGTITDSFLAFVQFLQQPKITRNHNFKQRQRGLMETHPWAQIEDIQTRG